MNDASQAKVLHYLFYVTTRIDDKVFHDSFAHVTFPDQEVKEMHEFFRYEHINEELSLAITRKYPCREIVESLRIVQGSRAMRYFVRIEHMYFASDLRLPCDLNIDLVIPNDTIETILAKSEKKRRDREERDRKRKEKEQMMLFGMLDYR